MARKFHWRHKCPRCGSSQVVARRQRPRYFCRACGWRGDKPRLLRGEPVKERK